jgi:RNA polymerase sigma-70 factor (ECF subfamily)
MDREEQRVIIEKAKGGDEAALWLLLEQKKKSILLQSARMLNNIQDAEDASQEVMISLYNNIAKLRDSNLFDAWVSRIVVNTCNTMLGKNLRRKGELSAEDFYIDIKETDPFFLPAESIEKMEENERMRSLIAKLPEKRRIALEMYFLEEKSYAEIARNMNVAVSAVSSYISKAKKELKKAYLRQQEREK